MTTLEKLQEEVLGEYQTSELEKRISSTEMFAINHGFPEWHAQTIPDLLSSAISRAHEAGKKYHDKTCLDEIEKDLKEQNSAWAKEMVRILVEQDLLTKLKK